MSSGFKFQSMLLARMFFLIDSGKIDAPIYSENEAPLGTSNKDYINGFVTALLERAFSNLQP
jgi:exportin-1